MTQDQNITALKNPKSSGGERKNLIKVISLFSGCGGMDLGFQQEGFNIVWANDLDQAACDTYGENIGKHIVPGDIQELDYGMIPDADLILGGFPCQDFSTLWKRDGFETERGNLYRNFVELVTLKEPLMFIAENVKGLMTANQGQAIKQIIEDFSLTGKYGYTTTPHLVNFADYGTPQLRERVLIIGVRRDIDYSFEIPTASHSRDSYISARVALSGVEEVEFNNCHQKVQPGTIEKLKLIPPGGNFSDIPQDSPHYVKGMISHVYRRLHPDQPSTTIIAAGGGGTWGYHYAEPRPLTNRERARLFGYPDDFVFRGTIAQVRKQIGNSVPPVGIRPFAHGIKSFLDVVQAELSNQPVMVNLNYPLRHQAPDRLSTAKKPSITALKNQKSRLEDLGYLLDCWIGKYRPGGTARGNHVYFQLRSRKPLSNGKKSKHLKREELPHYRRLIANGRQLRRINRQLKKLHYKLATREVLTSSETNEWYTPPGYVDLARSVMQGIDLDPASNAVAQQWIGAGCHYTAADNGLLKPWFGSVWLNPPYGGQVGLWIDKAIDEYDQGNIQQGIILVKPAVGSSWYQQLSSRYGRCEPHKRIKFIDADGKQQSSPVHGNVFFYLGQELGRFKDVFSAIGTVSAPL